MIKEIREQQLAQIEKQMRDLVEKYRGGAVKVETFIQSGSAADSILSFAEEHNIDLITMGTHGRRGLDRLLVGSTLDRVVRKARCAVLAVHEPVRDFVSPASTTEPVQLRRVLWCTDFSDDSPRALEFALSLAFEYNAELTLLHVLETSGGLEHEARGLALLEDVIPDEARSSARITPLVRSGKPYQEIIELATQSQTDLIVMGVRGRNIVDLSIFGSTTQRVIQLGPCPVLTVRS
jgi:nucleotide-binding universal stress UspA family protein